MSNRAIFTLLTVWHWKTVLSLSVSQVGMTVNFTPSREEEMWPWLAKYLTWRLTLREPQFILGPDTNIMNILLPIL